MRWELKDAGTRRPSDLPDHIDRRLRFALARFSDRVERVVVYLKDRNGPRGGIDKVCRILAKVRGCGITLAAVVDSDWIAAVDRAANRIGHAVSRDVERFHGRLGRLDAATRRHRTPAART